MKYLSICCVALALLFVSCSSTEAEAAPAEETAIEAAALEEAPAAETPAESAE